MKKSTLFKGKSLNDEFFKLGFVPCAPARRAFGYAEYSSRTLLLHNPKRKEWVKMKFFIDTANVEEIRQANEMGIICGVTTNPSLIAKEGRDF